MLESVGVDTDDAEAVSSTKAVRSLDKKVKRKASAYSKRYGAAFKRLAPKYKLKSGSWKKGGFKACQKAAHKAAKGGKK